MNILYLHTSNRSAEVKRSITVTRLLSGICALFLWTSSLPVLANTDSVVVVQLNDEARIVVASSDSSTLSISEGTITASQGKTIRLLPGTHIKASEDQIVNICSKAEQEQLAKEATQRKEKEMLTKAGEKRNEVNTPLTASEAFPYYHYAQLPPEPASVEEQALKLVAALSNSNTPVSAPVSFIDKKRTSNICTNFTSSAIDKGYTPVYQWGERAETIKILRC